MEVGALFAWAVAEETRTLQTQLAEAPVPRMAAGQVQIAVAEFRRESFVAVQTPWAAASCRSGMVAEGIQWAGTGAVAAVVAGIVVG